MVTVIITTYGGDLRLSRAIKSVLNQSYKDIQLVVVDDNNPSTNGRKSTERQMELFCNETCVEYIKHSKNINAAAARNTGINVAKGEYVCFLDDDDYFLHDHIEMSVKCCKENADCIGVVSNVVIITAGMLSDIYITDKDTMSVARVLKTHNIGTGSNLFVKTEMVKKISGFDENFFRNQDIEFILRLLNLGSIKCNNRFSIVKDISSSRKLDYYKLKKSYEIFDKKFKGLINKHPIEFQKEYYAERVHSLLATAMISGDKEAYEEAKHLVDKLDKASEKEEWDFKHRKVVLGVRRFINFFKYGRGFSIFNMIIKLKYLLSHMKYRKNLGIEKTREIYKNYRKY